MEKPVIGLMGAMPDEIARLCAHMEQRGEERAAGVTFYTGVLRGRRVVLCCAGMGKVNAACAAQLLVTKFGAGALIFSGIAGNMTDKIGVGDVVIGKTLLYHDAERRMIAESYYTLFRPVWQLSTVARRRKLWEDLPAGPGKDSAGTA